MKLELCSPTERSHKSAINPMQNPHCPMVSYGLLGGTTLVHRIIPKTPCSWSHSATWRLGLRHGRTGCWGVEQRRAAAWMAGNNLYITYRLCMAVQYIEKPVYESDRLKVIIQYYTCIWPTCFIWWGFELDISDYPHGPESPSSS